LRRRYVNRRADILADIGGLLDSGLLIGGEPVSGFESAFADWCGCAHAIGVANGTDALEFALRSVGVGAGDEVICVANAGGYATVVCQTIGARPVYIDVAAETLQLDFALIGEALSPATRAIIVTHLYGWMNDVEAVRRELARLGRPDVLIVEDCAQAHGARRGEASAGSLGDVAAFSFYPTKNMGALGDAGCVTCQDEGRAAHLLQLRQYGWSAKYQVTRAHGRNSRLDPIQALGLRRELDIIDAGNLRRRAVWRRYREALPNSWGLIGIDDAAFVAHLAIVVAPDEAARDRMQAALRERGIGTDIHYPILDCDQAGWRGVGRVAGKLDASRAAVGRILSLPCFPELGEDEQAQVIEAMRHGA
jgi:dTDP-4-amino-4,6-dideoxygalactose transaminase